MSSPFVYLILKIYRSMCQSIDISIDSFYSLRSALSNLHTLSYPLKSLCGKEIRAVKYKNEQQNTILTTRKSFVYINQSHECIKKVNKKNSFDAGKTTDIA